jgi:hypothetical protein
MMRERSRQAAKFETGVAWNNAARVESPQMSFKSILGIAAIVVGTAVMWFARQGLVQSIFAKDPPPSHCLMRTTRTMEVPSERGGKTTIEVTGCADPPSRRK